MKNLFGIVHPIDVIDQDQGLIVFSVNSNEVYLLRIQTNLLIDQIDI